MINKGLTIIIIIFLISVFTFCSSDDEVTLKYEFTSEYTATVTVGGVVGITERTFKIGEVYQGTDTGKETISIRIAEHTELNKNCPNSWCYQELLDVPREFLTSRQ